MCNECGQHMSKLHCSNLIITIVSATLDVNPILLLITCKFLWEHRFTMLQWLSLTKWFLIQISIIHDNILTQVADKRRYGFGHWMNSSIIHDNICKLIHKKCHLKSYHSDIKYLVTLNTIFSVVPPYIQRVGGAWTLILQVTWQPPKWPNLPIYIHTK